MAKPSEIAAKIGVHIPMTNEAMRRIELCRDMLVNRPWWVARSEDVDGLRLPVTIVNEFSRLMLINSKLSVSGSARGDWINTQLQSFAKRLKWYTRLGCAFGGIVFRPYLSGKRLCIDAVAADRFFPVSYDDDMVITDAVLYDAYQIGDWTYHKLERHQWDRCSGAYMITNTAYRSKDVNTLGDQCSLKATEIWADVAPAIRIAGATGPLFAYFRVPALNTSDVKSIMTPVGPSVFAEAADLIKDADIHWARIDWEYEGSELAIDVSSDMVKPVKGVMSLPQRVKRLFRKNNIDMGDAKAMQVFSPAIRDVSLYNGLDNIFRRIESACNLAYGTLSNPQNVDKTAEEIRSSKQRSYAAVCDLQEALDDALHQLVDAMDAFCTLYSLAPAGTYELSCEWGDGVLEDTDKEFQRRLQLVTAGKLKAEKLIAWYFGCSEEEAADYIPDSTGMDLFGGEKNVIT